MAPSPSTSPEAARRGAALIAIARDAIARDSPVPSAPALDAWLQQPAATFVTLRMHGDLRGCIGSLEARRPLADDVAWNAYSAAYRDPRFPPLEPEEAARLEIEVSVLSAPEPLQARTEAEVLAQLRPRVDGVVFEFGDLRSTFLPQVWDSLPDPADFLGELKRKAGLPASFWDPDVKLSRYTVEKFR